MYIINHFELCLFIAYKSMFNCQYIIHISHVKYTYIHIFIYIYLYKVRFNRPTPSRTPINPLNTLPNLRFLPTSDESNHRSVDRSELLIAQTDRQPIIDHIIISNRRGSGVGWRRGGGVDTTRARLFWHKSIRIESNQRQTERLNRSGCSNFAQTHKMLV